MVKLESLKKSNQFKKVLKQKKVHSWGMYIWKNQWKDFKEFKINKEYKNKFDGSYIGLSFIIKNTLISLGADKNNLETLIAKAKQCEEDANQILDFTKTVKNLEENLKIKLIETLWRIIYSDKNVDLYEASLMRRLAGLLYIASKTLWDIKNKIYNENLKWLT